MESLRYFDGIALGKEIEEIIGTDDHSRFYAGGHGQIQCEGVCVGAVQGIAVRPCISGTEGQAAVNAVVIINQWRIIVCGTYLNGELTGVVLGI